MQFRVEHLFALIAFWTVIILAVAAIVYYLKKSEEKLGRYIMALFCFGAAVLSAAIIGFAIAREGFELINLLAMGVFLCSPVFLMVIQTIARKNKFKTLANSLICLALLVVAVGIDAFLVEPKWLETTHVVL